MDEFFLNVDSLDRISGTISNFTYQYTSRNVSYNQPYKVSLKKLEFPAGCYYQVNSTNNILYYTINTLPYTFTAPAGNYTINEILSQINSKIASDILDLAISGYTFTLSYNTIFNKVGFIEAGANAGSNEIILLASGNSNINTHLGLTANLTSSTVIQYFQNQVDMSPLDYIFLRCNQMYSDSFISSSTQANDIIYRIQLASQRNSKTYIDEQSNDMNMVLCPRLQSSFNFYLTDRNGNPIELNGVDYSFMLSFKKISE